jgi:hypothetical protein
MYLPTNDIESCINFSCDHDDGFADGAILQFQALKDYSVSIENELEMSRKS